jgi:predicted ferric reductase
MSVFTRLPEGTSATGQPPPATGQRRMRTPGRPITVDVLAGLAGLGLGITIGLAIMAEGSGSLAADGGILTAIGRVTGLVSAYGMAMVVLLSARISSLERAVGQDRLVLWHRRVAPWTLYLLLAHVLFITLGYGQAASQGVLHEIWALVWTYPGMLEATVATGLLVAVGTTSYRRARRRLKYETWWAIHLYTYLALFLSYFHEIDNGASFVGHPVARLWWLALWIGTLSAVVGFRIGLPIWRTFRHRLRVVSVYGEGPDVFSVLLEGRRLDRLPVAGGQYILWRFLRRGIWWQAHPYSLSAVPTSTHMRITVKGLGDHSVGLEQLQPGTRVAFEGPYGVFTDDARVNSKVLLIGAGAGLTPLRALLDDLSDDIDVVVILRGSRREDLVLFDEFAAHVHGRNAQLHTLVGNRHETPVDAPALSELVPDIASRDLYVCGPDGFTEAVVVAAVESGVPEQHIHRESFAF